MERQTSQQSAEAEVSQKMVLHTLKELPTLHKITGMQDFISPLQGEKVALLYTCDNLHLECDRTEGLHFCTLSQPWMKHAHSCMSPNCNDSQMNLSPHLNKLHQEPRTVKLILIIVCNTYGIILCTSLSEDHTGNIQIYRNFLVYHL